MRHEKAGLLLKLARRLAASAEGCTLDEIAHDLAVSRRTAERLRDALWDLFPQMEEVADGSSKRFRISGGLDGFFQSPTTEELVELSRAIDALRAGGHRNRADTLASLEQKVLAALKSDARRRITPDVEALSRAELTGVRAGPQPVEDPHLVAAIRKALMGLRKLRFRYLGGSAPGDVRVVSPYGLFFERMNYLVAAETDGEPRNWRLDRIRDIEVLEETGGPPATFSLHDYAARSFGIFQDGAEDVVLRILPEAAEEARRWRFHPTQSLEEQADGSIIARFRSGGLREIAWHLFTWRDGLEILAPERLKQVMRQELRLSMARHGA